MQFFAHYTEWEDFKNGMYCGTINNDTIQINKSKSLLSDPDSFYKECILVVTNWPISTKVNLTNSGINKRAWLGQAACSYKYGVPEILTRIAWGELNDIQRFEANTVAEIVIEKYLTKQIKLF